MPKRPHTPNPDDDPDQVVNIEAGMSFREEQVRQAVLLLMSGASPEQVGDRLGVTSRTVYRWRNTPEGQRALREAHQEVYRRVARSISTAALNMVSTLAGIATDDEQPGQVRVNAAGKLLSAHLGVNFLDVDVGEDGTAAQAARAEVRARLEELGPTAEERVNQLRLVDDTEQAETDGQ